MTTAIIAGLMDEILRLQGATNPEAIAIGRHDGQYDLLDQAVSESYQSGYDDGYHAAQVKEAEPLRAELAELWHFATCPFDHCERCCAQEGVIKGIRNRLRTSEQWADAALVWRKTHPEQE